MRPPSPVKARSSARLPQSSEWSRHLLRAQEEERKRISRELHDGTGQGLMVLRLYLAMLASENIGPESQAKVQEALKLLDHTIEDLRRIIGRLSPRVLEEMGLLAAIRKLVQDMGRTTGLRAQLELPKEFAGIDRELEIALYRSLQEALHNVAKHAQAQKFAVLLGCDDKSVWLQVQDDGVGSPGPRRVRSRNFGLLGMRERIAALGGKVRICSGKDNGFSIKITVPRRRPESENALARLVDYDNSNSAPEMRSSAASR